MVSAVAANLSTQSLHSLHSLHLSAQEDQANVAVVVDVANVTCEVTQDAAPVVVESDLFAGLTEEEKAAKMKELEALKALEAQIQEVGIKA